MPDGTRFGDEAVYECNSGYSMKNYFKRTCQSNGTWSGDVPTCESSSKCNMTSVLVICLKSWIWWCLALLV